MFDDLLGPITADQMIYWMQALITTEMVMGPVVLVFGAAFGAMIIRSIRDGYSGVETDRFDAPGVIDWHGDEETGRAVQAMRRDNTRRALEHHARRTRGGGSD